MPATRLSHYLANTPAGKQNSAAIAYLASLDYLNATNPEVAASIAQELIDQRSYL